MDNAPSDSRSRVRKIVGVAASAFVNKPPFLLIALLTFRIVIFMITIGFASPSTTLVSLTSVDCTVPIPH